MLRLVLLGAFTAAVTVGAAWGVSTYDEAKEALEREIRGAESWRDRAESRLLRLRAIEAGLEAGRPAEPPDEPPEDPPIEPPADGSVPIVYSRIRRTTGTVETMWKGVALTVTRPDIYDELPEVSRMTGEFSAPGQLVLRRGESESILYDCVPLSEPCVPLDVAVSYDGTRALFSVYRGRSCAGNWNATGMVPALPTCLMAGAYEAQLHEVVLSSGEVTPLAHTPGTFDTGPVYLPGGGILYTSNKGGPYRPVLRRQTSTPERGLRLWIRDKDGDRLVAPHTLATSGHPYVLSNGRIIYSEQRIESNLGYRATNGGYNWPGTLDNLWWITEVDQRGGHWNNALGGHVYMSALHFLGETSDGWVLADHYYRANNKGGGEILMWKPEPIDIEGAAPGEPVAPSVTPFAPRTLRNLATWVTGRDEKPKMFGGEFSGKLRDPTGLPGGHVLLSFGRGLCTTVAGTPVTYEADTAGQPRACDHGIYRTTVIPSTSPADLELVVDSPEWHELMPRVALPYRDIYGKDQPDAYAHTPSEDGVCGLKMASMESETTPAKGYSAQNFRACGMQGCELDGTQDADIRGVRFWEVIPNASPPRGFNSIDNVQGNVVRWLGDAPVQDDGSAYVTLPCDTPYVMAGLDEGGRVVKRDQATQSLRPGEQRECSGCHLHSRDGPSFAGTIASSLPPTPLGPSTPVTEWTADVLPYLETSCKTCHESDAWMWDYEALVWDFRQATATRGKTVANTRTDAKNTYMQRPYISRWISSDFARASLLYWKCLGRRDDNHTDAQYEFDVDFGADHVASDGCAVIGNWIDSGAYRAK